MFFNKKGEQEKPKYEAIYKSLHSGKTRACVVTEPTDAMACFLYEDEDIWETYVLVSVMPLGVTDNKK